MCGLCHCAAAHPRYARHQRFRTIFFLPNLIGGILLGYIWQILLNGVLANLQKSLLALDAKATALAVWSS